MSTSLTSAPWRTLTTTPTAHPNFFLPPSTSITNRYRNPPSNTIVSSSSSSSSTPSLSNNKMVKPDSSLFIAGCKRHGHYNQFNQPAQPITKPVQLMKLSSVSKFVHTHTHTRVISSGNNTALAYKYIMKSVTCNQLNEREGGGVYI